MIFIPTVKKDNMYKFNALVIALSVLLSVSCANNNAIPDLKVNNLKGKVKSITETEVFGSILDKTTLKKVIHYDKNGYIEKVDNYNYIDEDTLKIGEFILYDNNLSDRKSYKINTDNDTLEIATHSYYKDKIIVNFNSLKGMYNSKIIYELNDTNNALTKQTKVTKWDEVLVDNVLIQNFKENNEIDFYTIEDKITNSVKSVKLENTSYDSKGNILTFTINETPTSSYTVTKVYEYYK